jgi:hypothetical protein
MSSLLITAAAVALRFVGVAQYLGRPAVTAAMVKEQIDEKDFV